MLYDAEIMAAFIEEIAEYLPQLRRHLNKLAAKPRDKEALEEAYRLSHTIKGSAAMLELNAISAEGRSLEQSLLPVVEKKLAFTPPLAQQLLTHVDTVEELLNGVKRSLDEAAAPPPPPPPLAAYEAFSVPPPPAARFEVETLPGEFDLFGTLAPADMPPIGFNESLVPPPPPLPSTYQPHSAADPALPDFSAGPSLPAWLDDEPTQPFDSNAPTLPPPPPPAFWYGLDSAAPRPPSPPPPARLYSPPSSLPAVPPPASFEAASAGSGDDMSLMDFLFDPQELASLEQTLFVSKDSFGSPPPERVTDGQFMPSVDFGSFEPQLELRSDLRQPSSPSFPVAGSRSATDQTDAGLADILATAPVDQRIDALQNEILSELPPHLTRFDSVPLPAEIGVSDAELLVTLGNDAMGSSLSNLHGLDNGNQLTPLTPALPASFGPLSFGEPPPSDLETAQLNDFTAAEDLLAEFEPESPYGLDFDAPAQLSSIQDDAPTVKAVLPPFSSSFDESAFASLSQLNDLPPFTPVAPSIDGAALDLDNLHDSLNAGAEDHAATLAGLDSLRGLPSMSATPPSLPGEVAGQEDDLDGAVEALEREASELPDELTAAQLAEAGFGGDDTELGAFFLAEGQADLEQLKVLIAGFAHPVETGLDKARQIETTGAALRKAAVLMDLEAVGRQLSVMENTASLVQAGELPVDAGSEQLFQVAYDELMALLAPFEAAAANLFALPDPQSQTQQEETDLARLADEPTASSPITRPVMVGPVGELDTELAEVFATEAEEHIQNLDTRLAALERDPHNRELLREIRRTAHTLKGSAAMVGFGVISQTAHLMEDLLDRLYDGSLEVDEKVVELLFVTFNTIDVMVRGLSAARPEDPNLLESLRPHYAALLDGEPESEESVGGGAVIFTPRVEPTALKTPRPVAEAGRRVDDATVAELEAAMAAANADPTTEVEAAQPTTQTAQPTRATAQTGFEAELAVRVPIKRLDIMMNQIGELVINRTVLERRNQILNHTVDELMLSIKRLQRVTRELETRYEVELLKNEAVPVGAGAGGRSATTDYADYSNGNGHRTNNDYSLPESGSEFDSLEMDRYTEFHTLSREMTETVDDLAAALRELDHLKGDLENVVVQQSRLTDDLQERVVKVRLVPVSNLTPRLYRTVRSLAAQEQKEVEFVVSGEQTQLDKTIFEELGDPLLHLVRNAIDHGLESPDEREAVGKPRVATLTFAARSEGSQVVIEVRDDGRGIEVDRVREVGLKRGLIPPDATLSDEELYDLMFVPGFSTSETITDVSGRGVGLDVVRANIARLKGTVEVTSERGKGTAFIIRLPSTLAISRALLVKLDGYTYAVPLSSIERTIRTEPDAIEEYDQRTFYRLEEGMLPLLELNGLLQLHPHQRRSPDDEDETNRSQFALRRERPLLLINGPERAVVRVDALIGQQEVVVKPLGTHLKNVPGVIGATILGSGEVILILNMYELIAATTGRRTRYGSSARLPQVVTQPMVRRGGTGTLSEVGKRRRPPLIQVVDDSLSVRKVLSAALEKAGFRVRTSKDGQEALEMVQQVPPDLIVMDIEMPRMDGYELTSLLKSRESFRRIPIVMLTSRAGLKHRQKAEEVGADGFLVKPYREQELLQIVSALLVMAH